jgi:hypothetical protein
VSNALIVSTAYDRESAITRRWAERLRGQLLNRNSNNLLVDGSALNQTALQDLLSFADYFVFFGHGTQTELVSRPAKGMLSTATALANSSSAGTLFSGCPVYAVCCDARQSFGQQCTRGFVGYDTGFPIKESAEEDFSKIVVSSAISFVSGTPVSQIAANTKQMWLDLAADFDPAVVGAQLAQHQDAAWGKMAAEALAVGIGKAP